MRRLTPFQLLDPAWGPDGKWIAFDNGGVIYKMPFDGVKFDTTQVTMLTDNVFSHFFPTWSPTGDTIYYDSNKDAPEHTDFYSIWKAAADGSGETRITDTTTGVSNGDIRRPFCTPGNQILHFRYPKGSQQMQVFVMDANGNNIHQITNNPDDFTYTFYLGYYSNKVFFEGLDLWSCSIDGSNLQKIATNSFQGFSISKNGIIAYVNFDSKIIDKTHACIWLTDITGNSPSPFIYNIY